MKKERKEAKNLYFWYIIFKMESAATGKLLCYTG